MSCEGDYTPIGLQGSRHDDAPSLRPPVQEASLDCRHCHRHPRAGHAQDCPEAIRRANAELFILTRSGESATRSETP